MYHHSTRPSPVVCALAGSLCTVGVIGIIARALDQFTHYTLAPPLDLPSFLTAVFATTGGGVWIAWLTIRRLRADNANLRARNAELRAERDKFDALIQAVKAADEQGEKNYVRLGKVIKMIEGQRANDDTQDIPRPRLHGINGGGGA